MTTKLPFGFRLALAFGGVFAVPWALLEAAGGVTGDPEPLRGLFPTALWAGLLAPLGWFEP